MINTLKQCFLVVVLCCALNDVTKAQEDPCGPFLTAMETIRLPEWDEEGGTTGRTMTLSTSLPNNRYELVVFYTTPDIGDRAISYDMAGGIDWVNKKTTPNTLKFRQSLYVPEGFTPFIPADSPVCWNEETRRLITYFEKSLSANETIEEDQISWTIELRRSNQVADITLDGIVDGADQGILMAEWNTNSYRSDLNQDGLVDSADYGILLSQWSESSGDG